MHILFVQPQPCIRALKYAEGLGKIHPDIRLSFAFLGNTLTELYGHGDECFEAWFPLSSNPASELRKIVATYDIDLIHSHNAPDTLTTLCIDLFGGEIPIVHDIHDLMSARETAYEDGLDKADDAVNSREEERQAIERSDAVITVSNAILSLARRQGYRLPEITHVYANYIPERFIPKTISQNGPNVAGRPIRIVYEGFVSSNGGHYDLHSIFRALAAEGIEVHIYPSRHNSDYQSLADIVPNIVYHGRLSPEKLFKEITQYDFGWAGFNDTLNRVHLDTVLPNKLFEYIACGLPVISFPHEALKHFLETHHAGLVIDTISGLAERLRTLEMVAVRGNVRRHRWDFTVEANIGWIVNIYRQLCDATVSLGTNGHRIELKSGSYGAY
ncbi:MAG: glycosyltransferase [Syntrophobacterales bacterium]|jgi:glycosyltransferase involved in cell wall biosynthesis